MRFSYLLKNIKKKKKKSLFFIFTFSVDEKLTYKI